MLFYKWRIWACYLYIENTWLDLTIRNPSEMLRAFWDMPEPWEDAMARKTLCRADLHQPGSSPDFHAGALLGQPPPPSFLWKPTALSVFTVWPMDDLHFPGLLARPAKSQILVLGAQKYALKKKKKISAWFSCTLKCVNCVRVEWHLPPAASAF